MNKKNGTLVLLLLLCLALVACSAAATESPQGRDRPAGSPGLDRAR